MKAVVLFDGVCNLCHASVRFIAKRDPGGYFRFAALQSEAGREQLARHGETATKDSLVLCENGACFRASDAALRIARRLRFPWPLLYVAILIPRFLRDPLYAWIAKNRYRWFGKKEFCEMEAPEWKDRSLTSGRRDNPKDESPRERN